MKYAVISLAGFQHVVTEGETLTVNRLPQAEGDTVKLKDVLLVVDGDVRTVGAPLVPDAIVTLKVVTHGKGDKIRVAKFKAKSRYHKVIGHRQPQTTVEVVAIGK